MHPTHQPQRPSGPSPRLVSAAAAGGPAAIVFAPRFAAMLSAAVAVVHQIHSAVCAICSLQLTVVTLLTIRRDRREQEAGIAAPPICAWGEGSIAPWGAEKRGCGASAVCAHKMLRRGGKAVGSSARGLGLRCCVGSDSRIELAQSNHTGRGEHACAAAARVGRVVGGERGK